MPQNFRNRITNENFTSKLFWIGIFSRENCSEAKIWSILHVIVGQFFHKPCLLCGMFSINVKKKINYGEKKKGLNNMTN